jgi:MFS family permease
VAATAPVPPALRATFAGGGLGLMVLFAARQLRAPHPLLDLRLLAGNHAFALSNLAALINYAATNAVAFVLSLDLQQALGLHPRQAGTVLLAQPAMQALLSPVAGRLSDRLEPGRIASVGMGITVLGLVGLAVPGAAQSLPAVVGCLLTLGLGFALFSSPNTNVVMSAVDRRHYGIAASTLGTMRLVGQMLSMALTVQLLAALGAEDKITPLAHEGFSRAAATTFAVLAGLCVLGVAASLVRNRNGGHREAE